MTSLLERNKNIKIQPKKTREEHAEDALYREVWEEVNAQKTYLFVKNNLRWLIAGALVVLITVVGVQLYRSAAQKAKIESAMAYEAAMSVMQNGHPTLAAEALYRAAEKSNRGTADLAIFQAARLDIMAGDRASAIEKLTALSKDGNTRDFRDIAIINLASLQGDTLTAAEFEKLLAPVQTKSSPFYYTGLLMVGQKYLAIGNMDSARKWFDKIINDKDAPAAIVANAESLR